MGKEPCENCGLTNYNTIRKCWRCSHKEIQKFGCDHCFENMGKKGDAYPGLGHGDPIFLCPDCYSIDRRKESIVAIVLIFGFLLYYFSTL